MNGRHDDAEDGAYAILPPDDPNGGDEQYAVDGKIGYGHGYVGAEVDDGRQTGHAAGYDFVGDEKRRPPERVAHQSQGNDGVVFYLVPDVAGSQFQSHDKVRFRGCFVLNAQRYGLKMKIVTECR